jgi:hypothetical protein
MLGHSTGKEEIQSPCPRSLVITNREADSEGAVALMIGTFAALAGGAAKGHAGDHR